MMDKCKLFQRLVAGVLCAGLLVGYVPAEARAAEDDTQVVDSVFSDVVEVEEVEEVEAEPVSETESAIFSAVMPAEDSEDEQIRNLSLATAAVDGITVDLYQTDFNKRSSNLMTSDTDYPLPTENDGLYKLYYYVNAAVTNTTGTDYSFSYQWQYSFSGEDESWYDVTTNGTFEKSPTSESMYVYFRDGSSKAFLREFYLRMKVSGDFGEVYSTYKYHFVPTKPLDIEPVITTNFEKKESYSNDVYTVTISLPESYTGEDLMLYSMATDCTGITASSTTIGAGSSVTFSLTVKSVTATGELRSYGSDYTTAPPNVWWGLLEQKYKDCYIFTYWGGYYNECSSWSVLARFGSYGRFAFPVDWSCPNVYSVAMDGTSATLRAMDNLCALAQHERGIASASNDNTPPYYIFSSNGVGVCAIGYSTEKDSSKCKWVDVTHEGGNISVETTISDLEPNTVYYFYAKDLAGNISQTPKMATTGDGENTEGITIQMDFLSTFLKYPKQIIFTSERFNIASYGAGNYKEFTFGATYQVLISDAILEKYGEPTAYQWRVARLHQKNDGPNSGSAFTDTTYINGTKTSCLTVSDESKNYRGKETNDCHMRWCNITFEDGTVIESPSIYFVGGSSDNMSYPSDVTVTYQGEKALLSVQTKIYATSQWAYGYCDTYQYGISTSFDGEKTWQDSSEFTVTEPGTYYFWTMSYAGFVSTAECSVDIAFDTTAPTVSSFEYVADSNTPGKVTLTATASDDVGIAGYYLQAVTDGSTPTAPAANDSGWVESTQGTYSWDETINQNVTYYVWAKDQVGNVSEVATKVFKQPTIHLRVSQDGVFTSDLLDWMDYFVYGGYGGRVLEGIITESGSSDVKNWQWQRRLVNSADTEDWEDITAEMEHYPNNSNYSPWGKVFRSYAGYGRIEQVYDYRVKASGDWGEVYSPAFRVRPVECVGVSAKAILSGTSEEYTNGPVTIQLTLKSPRVPADSKIYGYKVTTSAEYPDVSDYTVQSQAGVYEVQMGSISEDTTFYSYAIPVISGNFVQNTSWAIMDVKTTIKYDAKAPEITGVTVDAKAKTITVTAVDVAGTDADGNTCGASGIVAYAIVKKGSTPTDSDWKDANAEDPTKFTFSGLTNGTLYDIYVKDGAGNIGYESLIYMPEHVEKSITLETTDSEDPQYIQKLMMDVLPIVSGGMLYTRRAKIEMIEGPEFEVVPSSVLGSNYHNYGSLKANSQLAIGFTSSLDEEPTSSYWVDYDLYDMLQGKDESAEVIFNMKFVNAAAYTVQEDRVFKLTIWLEPFGSFGDLVNALQKGDTSNTVIFTITIPGIDNKTISFDVDMNSTITLEPGVTDTATSEAKTITNNNAYPIDVKITNASAANDSTPNVAASIDKTKELKEVMLGIQRSDTDAEYYSGNPITVATLGYEAQQQFRYIMQYSHLYTGSEKAISYNINYSVSVSAEDVTS